MRPPYGDETFLDYRMRIFVPLLTMAVLAGTAALAKPPLRDVTQIDNGVMTVAIADAIRKSCEDINPRLIRAYSALNALKSMAREKGYSDEEVEHYVTSKEEKARMKAKAERYLASQGVTLDDRPGLCRFGREQIAAETAIGRLLR